MGRWGAEKAEEAEGAEGAEIQKHRRKNQELRTN